MIYELLLSGQAKKDLESHAKAGDRKKLEKIYLLLEELTRHPETGTGKPEKLKHEFAGLWSRRIDEKNRLVYKINDTIITVIIIAAKGHYSDR